MFMIMQSGSGLNYRQMTRIKQKFMLARQRLPKKNCLVFISFAAIFRVFFFFPWYEGEKSIRMEAVRASAALALSAG